MSVYFKNITGAVDDYIYFNKGATFIDNPFTMNGWLYPQSPNSHRIAVAIQYETSVGNRYYSIGMNAALNGVFAARAGVGTTLLNSTTTGTNNAWNMVTGVSTSSTSRTVYLNNGGSATSTVSRAVGACGHLTFGGIFSDVGVNATWEGYIAEFALWDVTLSTDEITSLYKGAKASQIRPNNLVVYFPGIRSYKEITETLPSPTTTGGTNLSFGDHVRRYG